LSSWRWLKRRRAAGWPIADGRIEWTEVTKPTFSFTTKRGYYVAQVGYSYSVAGSSNSGLYKREFPTEPAADDFVRDLKGKAVTVRYSLSKPSLSMLLEPDIEAVLQNRSSSGDAQSVTRTAIPEWLRPFIWVFVWLSGIGLLVSLWVHVGALMGRGVPSVFWVLHVGIFVVWFPAFRLRICELHDLDGSVFQRHSPCDDFSRRFESILRYVDGFLLRCPRNSVLGCQNYGFKPALCEWALGSPKCALL